MLKFSADVKVNRPVEKVFDWLTNPENQGKIDKSSLFWSICAITAIDRK